MAWTWDNLARPVFDKVSALQTRTGGGIEVEHLFSDRLLAALQPLANPGPAAPYGRAALLTCAEDEQHSLPVHALAATLTAEKGIATRVLGARTPYSALNDAMRRLGPAVVFVWSQQPSTGDPAPLALLPAVRPPARTVVGGPGWALPLPAGVVRVNSLDEAVTTIADLVLSGTAVRRGFVSGE